MGFYTVRVDDSDGNDNTVIEAIVEAPDSKVAVNLVCDAIEKRCKANLESDGGYGYYRSCDCEIPEGQEDAWECSHGGITVSEPSECAVFDTYDAARASISIYHVIEDLTS